MDATHVARDQLDVAIWEGRRDGHTYRELADRHDVHHETIRRRFLRMLGEAVPPNKVHDHRALELARLEHQRSLAAQIVQDPSLEAKHRLAALRELRQVSRATALLLGLDAPREIRLRSDGSGDTSTIEHLFQNARRSIVEDSQKGHGE